MWINLEVPGLCMVPISQQNGEFALSDLPHDLLMIFLGKEQKFNVWSMCCNHTNIRVCEWPS